MEDEPRVNITLNVSVPDSLARSLPLDGMISFTDLESNVLVPLIRYLLCYRASKQRGTDALQTCG